MRFSILFVSLMFFGLSELSVNAQYFNRGFHQPVPYTQSSLSSSKLIGYPPPTMNMYHAPAIYADSVVYQGYQSTGKLRMERRCFRGTGWMIAPTEMPVGPVDQTMYPKNEDQIIPLPPEKNSANGHRTQPIPPLPPFIDKPIWEEKETPAFTVPKPQDVKNIIIPFAPSVGSGQSSVDITISQPEETTIPDPFDEIDVPGQFIDSFSLPAAPTIPSLVVPKPIEPIDTDDFFDSLAIEPVIEVIEEEAQEDDPFDFQSLTEEEEEEQEPVLEIEDSLEEESDPFEANDDDFDFGIVTTPMNSVNLDSNTDSVFGDNDDFDFGLESKEEPETSPVQIPAFSPAEEDDPFL